MINFITALSISRRKNDTSATDWNVYDHRLTKNILVELIEESLSIFETATQEIYDR